MEGLTAVLHRCDKASLVSVVKNLCAMFHLESEDVKGLVNKELARIMLAEQEQQEKDRDAFAVVLGTRKGHQQAVDVAFQAGGARERTFTVLGMHKDHRSQQTVADMGLQAGGKERACTGLLTVGADVLNFIATFLKWEKVKLRREWKAGKDILDSCCFSPCGHMLLTSSGNEMRLWDAVGGALRCTLKGHVQIVSSCCFFPDGQTIVSASHDRTIKLWDMQSGILSQTLEGHTDWISCLDVSSDGTQILSGSDRTAMLWKSTICAASGHCSPCQASGHSSPSKRPNGFCPRRTGDLQHTEQLNGDPVCCTFSPNGALFLVGCDASLRLYNSTPHQLQHTLSGHAGCVMSCSFAPDGNTILSGSSDSAMKLWSTATGQLLRKFDGHFDSLYSCAFSPSGQTIISASHDMTLMLWTAATGQLQRIVDAHSSLAVSTCVSRDGKFLLSGYNDGTAKMWSVECFNF